MSDYLSTPVSPGKRGILVLHAWWGVNGFLKEFCDRLAAQGYAALAIDLYGGKTAQTIPEAEKLRGTLTGKTVKPALLQGMDRLRTIVGGRPIGTLGFSLGAWWISWLNEEQPEEIAATVLFYGTRGMKAAHTHPACLGHFAEADPYVSDSGRQKMERELKMAGRQVEFHIYPRTHHWFFESDRPEYHAEAAQLAWQRSLEFLNTHL